MQQSYLDLGGVANDVVVTATGPQEEVSEAGSSWQFLARLPSIDIGEIYTAALVLPHRTSSY